MTHVASLAMNRFGYAVGLAVLVALLAAGCGSDTQRSQTGSLLETRLDPHSPHSFRDLVTAELEANNNVALCMKEQGFEYNPYSYSREQVRLSAMVGVYEDAETFATMFGYGITSPDMASPADDYVIAPIDVDHETALYGRPVSTMASDGEPPAGCWGEFLASTLERVEVFHVARQDLNALIDADAGVEQLRSGWSRCMALQGFSYYSPAEAQDYFRDTSGALLMSSGPGVELAREDFETLLREEIATASADQIDCAGIALRAERLEVAQKIGLSDEATTALEGLAS